MDEIGGDPGASFPANGLPGLFAVIDRLVSRAGTRIPQVHALQAHGMLQARGLLFSLVGLLLLVLLPPLIGWCLHRFGLLEPNFRGQRIPQCFGLVTLVWSSTMFACSAFLFLEQRDRALIWLAACAGYGTLGIIDDVRGAKAVKGLRGHLRAAIHDKVVTTGLIKAIGGVALAIWVARHLVPSSFPIQLLAVCVVALCANAINLLDLRPGRAGATFLVLAFPLVVVALLGEEAGAPPLLLVVIPTLLVWEADARGVVMMGDTGSNLLGAALGMSLVAEASVPCMALVVIALIVLHAYAERRSLTKVIENSPLLNKLDQLTGVR